MVERLARLEAEIRHLREQLEAIRREMITKADFLPVRAFVYGASAIIFGTFMTLIIRAAISAQWIK